MTARITFRVSLGRFTGRGKNLLAPRTQFNLKDRVEVPCSLFGGMMVLMVMMIRKLPSKCYDEFANLLSVEEVGIKRG